MSIASSGNCWSASKYSIDMLISFLSWFIDICSNISWVCFRVEWTHSSKQSAHHCHWMGIMSESCDELFKTLVISRVLQYFLCKSLQLSFSWELSIDEQEASLEEARFISKLLNRIASVLKNSLFSIDEWDLRNAVNSIHVCRIVNSCHSSSRALNLADISGVDCAIFNFKLVWLA